MWRLYQYPLCPFSRKVRFALAIKGVAVELVRELPWEKREAFLRLNPAGQTPVLQKDNVTLVDSVAICEYFEETLARAPLMAAGPEDRAEARRLVTWFDQKFYAEVTAPLLSERMYRRAILRPRCRHAHGFHGFPAGTAQLAGRRGVWPARCGGRGAAFGGRLPGRNQLGRA
jgi:glutathione S-transferase